MNAKCLVCIEMNEISLARMQLGRALIVLLFLYTIPSRSGVRMCERDAINLYSFNSCSSRLPLGFNPHLNFCFVYIVLREFLCAFLVTPMTITVIAVKMYCMKRNNNREIEATSVLYR